MEEFMVGKVLWWDDRYQEGQIITAVGMKFFFNSTVIKRWPKSGVKRSQVIEFKHDAQTRQGVCATEVTFPVGEQRKRIQRKFEEQIEAQVA